MPTHLAALFFLQESYRGATDRLQERLGSSKYISKFKLPPDEVLINDWTCALSKAVLLQGRVYLSQNYLCFYSKIFGVDTKEVIKLSDILSIKKRNKFVIGIEVFMKNGVDRYLFCSFLTRSRTFKAITDAWTRKMESMNPQQQQQQQQQAQLQRQLSPCSVALRDEDIASDSGNSGSSDSEMGEVDTMLTGSGQDRNGFLTAQPSNETIPQTIVPFTPVQFFYLFLSDKAQDFERQVKCPTPRLSLEIDPWKPNPEHNGMMTREMRSVVSLVELKAPIGPPESRVVETQRYVLTKDCLILQTRSFSLDIPYNDYFHTESEWVFTKVSPTASSLVGNGAVIWSKRSMMKGLIESTTIKQMKGQAAGYIPQTVKWGEDKKDLLDRIEHYITRSSGNGSGKHKKGQKNVPGKQKKKKDRGSVGSASDTAITTQLASVVTGNKQARPRNHALMVAMLCLILFYLVARVISLEKKLDSMVNTQSEKHEL